MQWVEEHNRKDVCRLSSKLASTTNTQIESSYRLVLDGAIWRYIIIVWDSMRSDTNEQVWIESQLTNRIGLS